VNTPYPSAGKPRASAELLRPALRPRRWFEWRVSDHGLDEPRSAPGAPLAVNRFSCSIGFGVLGTTDADARLVGVGRYPGQIGVDHLGAGVAAVILAVAAGGTQRLAAPPTAAGHVAGDGDGAPAAGR